MRRLNTISAFSIIGALSALLAGCPIWGDGGPGPGPTDAGPRDVILQDSGPRDVQQPDVQLPRACNTNEQCNANEYCDPVQRICVTTTTCGPSAPCAAGSYCDARNACVPGCGNDNDCAAVGTGLVCDLTAHRCVPGNQCDAMRPCTAGLTCVSGQCRTPASVCQFDYQCGSSAPSCVDGRCTSACSTTRPCSGGQVCVGGFCQNPTGTCSGVNCTSTQVCSGGVCINTCMTDTTCGAGNFCDNGVCRVDDRRPPPFCTPTSGCSPGSACIDGNCRIECPTPTGTETADQACQRRDVNTERCDTTTTPPICRFRAEASASCGGSLPACPTGQQCVNATCR